jgi:hypothetical protein
MAISTDSASGFIYDNMFIHSDGNNITEKEIKFMTGMKLGKLIKL